MLENACYVTRRPVRNLGLSLVLHAEAVVGLVLLGTVAPAPREVREGYSSVTIFAPTNPLAGERKVSPPQRRPPPVPPKRARVAQAHDNVAPVRKALDVDPPRVRIEPVAKPTSEGVQGAPPPVPAPVELVVETDLLVSAVVTAAPSVAEEVVQAGVFAQARAAQEAGHTPSVAVGAVAFKQVETSHGTRWRNARYERPTVGSLGFDETRAGANWPSAGETEPRSSGATSGEIKVLAVRHGLGDELDENVIEADRSIRFEPAVRDGESIDLVATVHIRFQLAY